MLKACFPPVPGRMFSFFGFVGGVQGSFGRAGGSIHFKLLAVTVCTFSGRCFFLLVIFAAVKAMESL